MSQFLFAYQIKLNNMKIRNFIFSIVLIMLAISCKKPDNNNNQTPSGPVPIMTTLTPSNIVFTTATSGGNITSDGGSTVRARGVCWSTGQTPTITDSKTTDGTGTGSFTSLITGLTGNTTYYCLLYTSDAAD